MNGKFIKTKELSIVNLLKSKGFTLLDADNNGIYTFLSNGKLTFDEEMDINNKVIYTNIMNI